MFPSHSFLPVEPNTCTITSLKTLQQPGASQGGIRPGPPLTPGPAVEGHPADAGLSTAHVDPLGLGQQGGGARAVGLQVRTVV